MILPFKKEFRELPTNFESKIWAGLIGNGISTREEFLFYSDNCKRFPMYDDYFGKIHSIRKTGRWKVGDKIHFTTGVRTKKHYQFAPVLEVVSKQKIKIEYNIWKDSFNLRENLSETVTSIDIDDCFINMGTFNKLSSNDGFYHYLDFLKWFDKDFEGEIIHWTNFKY